MYGRDRVIGQSVEGFVDVVHNMEAEEIECWNAHAMDETNEVIEENSTIQTTQTNAASTSTSRKQKQQAPTAGKEPKKNEVCPSIISWNSKNVRAMKNQKYF